MSTPTDATTTTTTTVCSEVLRHMNTNNMRGLWMPSVIITRAPATGRNPDCLYIKTRQNEYLGRITPEGKLLKRHAWPMPEDVQTELRLFAVGGVEALKQIGIMWGSCCFCGRLLEDPESVTKGYGPVCARHYGLPHGNRHGF